MEGVCSSSTVSLPTPPSPLRAQEQVFDAAYREHFAPLMRVAFLMTGSNETAEDVVQDVFLRCRSRLGDLDHARSYLRAAVINECRSVHRRAQRAPELTPPAHDEIPTELLDLRDALAALPWRQRAAIVLRVLRRHARRADRRDVGVPTVRPSAASSAGASRT